MNLEWHWGLDPQGIAQRIRFAVFVEEQCVPAELEMDEFDAQAWHLLGSDPVPVGTLRIFQEGDQWLLGRMAILKPYRNKGYGKQLIWEAYAKGQALGIPSFLIHAQTQASDFYRKLGFIPQGPIFMEAGIPHRMMLLVL